MVSVPRPRTATYDDYLALPDDQKAELIDGVLYLMGGPKGRHVQAASNLAGQLNFRFGLRGEPYGNEPGGWWILAEPEVHLRLDQQVVRPDLAGWRRDRMATPPADSHKFTVVPDWVCEVLSPSTATKDYLVKMPRYLRAGVRWVWIVDPVSRRVDAFRAHEGEWEDVVGFEGAVGGHIPPFDAVELDLGPLWS